MSMLKSRGNTELPRRPVNSLNSAALLLRYMKPWRFTVLAILGLSFISIGADLCFPLVLSHCIDSICTHSALSAHISFLFRDIGALAAVSLLSFAVEYLQEVLSVRLSTAYERELRSKAYSAVLKMKAGRIEWFRQGDIMSRLLNDTTLTASAFPEFIIDLIASAAVISGCVVIMLIKNVHLALVVIISGVISVFISHLISGMLLPRIREQQAALGNMNSHISDSILSFRAATEGGRTELDQSRMKSLNNAFYTSRIRVAFTEGLVEPLLLLAGNISFFLLVAEGARLSVSNAVTLGTIQAFILYSKQFTEPITSLGQCFVQFQNVLSGAERVFEIINSEAEEKKNDFPQGLASEDCENYIHIENVGFGYYKNIPVLKGLSLSVKKGQRIGIVGRTGAGKTTVINLLEGFYTDYIGTIKLNGEDIKDLPLEKTRKMITLVQQEPYIINGTIYENICYGVDDASENDIKRATEAAGISELIKSLPMGYDTVLDESKSFLSRGQLQLISLARCFLRKSEILILDEATSSLDPASESRLRTVMDSITKNKTCITVAHRLSSVKDSDVIYVIDKGRICESGTHSELMKAKGIYYGLFTSQYNGMEI